MVAGNGSGDSPGNDRSSLVRAPTRAAYSFADTDRAVIFPIRSRDTYVSRTLALVNFLTVGDDPCRRYPELELSPELLAGVDLVLLSSEPFPFRERHMEEIRAHAGARCPSIRLFDGEMASWYGSRAIRAMDYLARFAAEP